MPAGGNVEENVRQLSHAPWYKNAIGLVFIDMGYWRHRKNMRLTDAREGASQFVRRCLRRAVQLWLFASILCFASAAFGQMNTADITGSITDQTGAIVRATVTALQLATQEKRTAVTNELGNTLFCNSHSASTP